MAKTFLKFLEPYEKGLVSMGIKKKGVIIAVSGVSGSGKSMAVSFILETMPQLRRVYAGGVFREMAEKRGMSIEEFSKTRPKEDDYNLDRWMLKESIPGNVVSDGHIAAWVVGDWADLRIFIRCPLKKRAERVAKREGVSRDEAFKKLQERDTANAYHYRKIYGIDINDMSIYHKVIETPVLWKSLENRFWKHWEH